METIGRRLCLEDRGSARVVLDFKWGFNMGVSGSLFWGPGPPIFGNSHMCGTKGFHGFGWAQNPHGATEFEDPEPRNPKP